LICCELRFVLQVKDDSFCCCELQVQAVDLDRLEDDAFLNDTIIDFYLRYVLMFFSLADR
jgi:hypothetical protein